MAPRLNVMLEIDSSELQAELDRLKGCLKPEEIDKISMRIFRRTGQHVRKILKTDIPREYEVKAGEVSKAVGNAKVTGGGGFSGTGCIIPVRGPRKSIGGSFRASGGAHGWNSVHRKYRVKARIVRGQQSVLPANAASYGGMPPFRNLGSSLGGVTFTRAGKRRLPIMKVSGIAVPQMPMNRSEADVQRDIQDYMMKRFEHELQWLIGGK